MFPNSKEITIRYGRREFFCNWGWMEIDYVIRKDELNAITNESRPADIALYER